MHARTLLTLVWLALMSAALEARAGVAVSADQGQASAPIIGTPLQRRFMPEDYNAAPVHLAVASDAGARMLFGNVEGILRFDGENWDLIELPARAPARALALGDDQRVYVGSYDTFGWLDSDALGNTRYSDLLTAAGLEGEQRHVGVVWYVLPTPEGIYFRSDRLLHFLNYQYKDAKSWTLPPEARGFYSDGSTLYTRFQGQGYGRFVEGRLVLEPGGEAFSDRPLPAVIGMPGWRLLVAEDGLYRSDASGIHRLPGASGAVLEGSEPTTAARLLDGSLIVGTRSGELFQFGSDFTLQQRIKLGSHAVTALGADLEGGLWVATEGGLVRTTLPSRWSFLGPEHGLIGNVYDFAWFDGALWLAGSRGITRLTRVGSEQQAQHEDWVNYEAFALHATPQGLLIAHRDGTLLLEPGSRQPRELLPEGDGSTYTLLASRHEPGLIYALGESQLYLLRQVAGHWTLGQRLGIGDLSAAGIAEGAPGEIWLGNSRGAPRRWQIDLTAGIRVSETIYGSDSGITVDPDAGSSVYRLDGEIHVVSGERGYHFTGKRFEPDHGPPFALVDRPAELSVAETTLGTYAYTSRQLWHRPLGASEWQPVYLNPDLAAGYGNLRVSDDGVLRITTWSGLLQFDPRQPAAAPRPLALRVERVTARPMDGSQPAMRVAPGSDARPAEIPAGYTINLRFAMVSLESGAQYRYILHGVTPDWSDWSDRDLFIRALPAGEHALEIQARTRSGQISPTVTYRFITLPHWYERHWVQGLAVLGLLLLVSAVIQALIRRRTARLALANEHLEARIRERTVALEEANRQLAELAIEDGLTGIGNRRALEHGLRREWQRCMDQARPLSALMIDIDHFKAFNDSHGHLEGDLQLKAVAALLQQLHDPHRELLARYGGEEFTLLLPGVAATDAAARAEQLRASLAGAGLGLTVSIGVAGHVPPADSDPDSVLRDADAALYRAKRAGRNRVEANA